MGVLATKASAQRANAISNLEGKIFGNIACITSFGSCPVVADLRACDQKGDGKSNKVAPACEPRGSLSL